MLAGCCEWEDEQFHRGSFRNQAETDRDQTPGNRKAFAFGWEGMEEKRPGAGSLRDQDQLLWVVGRPNPRQSTCTQTDGCLHLNHNLTLTPN